MALLLVGQEVSRQAKYVQEHILSFARMAATKEAAMPYRPEHKAQTRARIVECARRLYNRRGFSDVSIDEVMAAAGLTRGGFYSHFKNKEELFAEAVACYAKCRPDQRWDGIEIDPDAPGRTFAHQVVNAYLSHQHLDDIESHCPMIALPSDAARAGPIMRQTYERLLKGLVGMFEAGFEADDEDRRRKALTIAALCVGGMVLARTVDDAAFASEIREAARAAALEVGGFDEKAESEAA
jgi:TetR/AcrR family transcriptional repressor of nem operon